MELGGKAVLIGASYDPAVLAGQTPDQVARCVGEPGSAVARQIGAASAAITESLCQIAGLSPDPGIS
jgi:hypothetical protein